MLLTWNGPPLTLGCMRQPALALLLHALCSYATPALSDTSPRVAAAMRLCERRRLRIQEHGRRASRPLHFFGSVLYCTHAVTDGASFDQRPFCWSDLALTLSCTFGGARRVFRSFFAQSKLASDFCCRIARLRTAATHSNRSPSAWIAPHRCCGEPSTTLHSCSSGRRHAAPPRALFPAARLRRRRAANASR